MDAYNDLASVPALNLPLAAVVDLLASLKFYARLASISDLDKMSKGERLVLLEQFKANFQSASANRLPREGAARDGERATNEVIANRLQRLHALARSLIDALLDGKVLRSQDLVGDALDAGFPLYGVTSDGRIGAVATLGFPPGHHEGELRRALAPGERFPFARCPICRGVFVQQARRKYCSPACTQRAAIDGRRDQRRAYMRAYMAKRRRKLKGKKAAPA